MVTINDNNVVDEDDDVDDGGDNDFKNFERGKDLILWNIYNIVCYVQLILSRLQ